MTATSRGEILMGFLLGGGLLLGLIEVDHDLEGLVGFFFDEVIGFFVVLEGEVLRHEEFGFHGTAGDPLDRLSVVVLAIHERADEADLAVADGGHVHSGLPAKNSQNDDVAL